MSVQLVAAIEEIRKGMINEGKAGGQLREDACVNLTKLVKENGKVIEPLVIAHIPAVLSLLGDKVRNVALAARTTLDSIVEIISPHSVKQILPSLLVQHTKWQANEGRLQLISRMCESSTAQMAHCLSDAIPAVCMDLTDLKPQVKDAAKKALLDLCNCCTNTDIVPFIPSLLNAMEDPSVIPETIFKLASTTFIQVVDGAALSVITPVLVRGFNKMNTTAIKRQSARIVENMSKLVEEPLYLAPFIPRILPLLEAAKDDVSDAECREVCQKAHETLLRKSDMSKSTAGKLTTQAEMLKVLNGVLAVNKVHVAPHAQAYVEFVAHICLSMNEIKDFHSEDWKQHIMPFLDFVFPQDQSEAVAQGIHREVVKDHEEAVAVQEVEEDAEELCNCNFSLAYGNKILLNNTHLKLKRGFRYGLVGKNDSGKTSLMRAIANHKVDGFPPEDELRTVFVETDIQGELSDLSVLNYIYADPLLANCGVSREHMATVLGSVGFVEGSPATINTPVGALSGGWKMKLALARAMLLRADILLLDEPTNHLDAYNVNWVESYLTGLKNVTCIIVSHDSGLLDRVCTHIIQIDDLKLFVHKGNLSEFVASHPEAKSYFELKTDKFKFTFPKPGNLPGITTRGKPIMKMSNVTFTYPGAPKPQLNNITIQVSMASRVACVGVNGAGKSTMIKLLTGELEPQTGDVWKHPNARVAYVAQHAFHHIENHLEKTPNEYIRWRYANGNDREALQKVTMVLTAEEEAKMKEPVMAEFTDAEGNIKREKAVIKRLTEGRRQLRNDVEYEAEFIGRQGQHWVKAERLMENGWEKVLKQIDESIAMRATMFARPLTQVNVEKHLEDVGLHREFGTHTRMAALSGGQKVKVVLAAAMWSQPHVLILDEPTNYLDRDSLGALAGAIREFEGGVVMITHNSQFCNSLCPEVWHLENNTLNVKGDAEWMQEAMKQKIETQALEEMVDAFGNVVKVAAAKKKLTRAQLKDKERKKKFMAKQGLTVDDSDDDY